MGNSSVLVAAGIDEMLNVGLQDAAALGGLNSHSPNAQPPRNETRMNRTDRCMGSPSNATTYSRTHMSGSFRASQEVSTAAPEGLLGLSRSPEKKAPPSAPFSADEAPSLRRGYERITADRREKKARKRIAVYNLHNLTCNQNNNAHS